MLERFWSKVNITDTCWLWTGALNDKGYGVFATVALRGHRNLSYAHRVSWSLHHQRPVPPDFDTVIDHMCSTPACVNPAHLQVLSRSENCAQHVRVTRKTHCGVCGTKKHKQKNGRIVCPPCQRQYARKHQAKKRRTK